MRLALLALPIAIASAAHAGPDDLPDYHRAYATAVGPAAFCGVPIDQNKAAAYIERHDLDATKVGRMVWEAQQEAYAASQGAKSAYCDRVAAAVWMIGLKP